jgi:DNA-binding NtrC family response regulator
VVDDEPWALRAITAALAIAEFRVMVAENGAAGLEAFLAHADEIALVLTDIIMPIMDGITMAEQIKKARPDARILLLTAYSDAVINLMNEHKFPLIRKPFLPDDLVHTINAQLKPPSATNG